MAVFDSKDVPYCSSQTELRQATESQALNMTRQQQQSKLQSILTLILRHNHYELTQVSANSL